MNDPEGYWEKWQKLIEAAAEFQKIFPEGTIIGGSAAALHAGHRYSFDVDFAFSDLKNRYEEVLDFLEGRDDWATARLSPPKLILGNFKGIETGLDCFLMNNLTLGLSYTWLDTENKDTHAELARRPSNKIVFKLKNEFKKLTTYFDISYVGHRTSDNAGTQLLKAYFLGNLSFDYKIKENLLIFTNFVNIFNEKYEEITGYQIQPFSAYAGLKVSF